MENEEHSKQVVSDLYLFQIRGAGIPQRFQKFRRLEATIIFHMLILGTSRTGE